MSAINVNHLFNGIHNFSITHFIDFIKIYKKFDFNIPAYLQQAHLREFDCTFRLKTLCMINALALQKALALQLARLKHFKQKNDKCTTYSVYFI